MSDEPSHMAQSKNMLAVEEVAEATNSGETSFQPLVLVRGPERLPAMVQEPRDGELLEK